MTVPSLSVTATWVSRTRASASPSFSTATASASFTRTRARPSAACSACWPSERRIAARASLSEASIAASARMSCFLAWAWATCCSASAFLMSLMKTSCAAASACTIVTCLWRLASESVRRSLIDSSSTATVLSTATRARMMSAIERFSVSTALFMSIWPSSTSRLRSTSSRSWALVTRTFSTSTSRMRPCSETWTERSLACSAIWIASSARWRSTCVRFSSSRRKRLASFSSRALAIAISLFFLASASARCCSKRNTASSEVRFCLPSSMRSFCLSWLVSIAAPVVIAVIFLMPSESRTLLGSRTSIGVCSR